MSGPCSLKYNHASVVLVAGHSRVNNRGNDRQTNNFRDVLVARIRIEWREFRALSHLLAVKGRSSDACVQSSETWALNAEDIQRQSNQ